MELIKNTRALVDSGQIDAGQALELASSFSRERQRELVEASLEIVLGMRKLVPDELLPKYREVVRDLFGKRARELGWSPKKGESEDDSLLRPILVPAVAAEGNDEELVATAKTLSDRWLKDRNSVAPEMAAGVLSVTAANSGREFYQKLVTELRTSKDRRERQKIVDAIARFRQPDIAADAMLLLFDSELDIRDVMPWLGGFQAQPETERGLGFCEGKLRPASWPSAFAF
ncbi:MAG: ERAP1-like C-terminal domain-containing protein [Bryobacteraceae bacterium]